jgi:hypothetical protein
MWDVGEGDDDREWYKNIRDHVTDDGASFP